MFKKLTEDNKTEILASLDESENLLDTIPQDEKSYNRLALHSARLAVESGDAVFAYLILQATAKANRIHDLVGDI